ncbi:MAG: type I polyketide synthase, partial [Actinocrinis sp.]
MTRRYPQHAAGQGKSAMAGEDKLRDYLKRVTVDLAEARRKLAEADARRYEPIAIVGMACRYPGADSVDDFWAALAAGSCAVADDVPGGRYDLGPYEESCGVYTRRGAFLSDIASWDARFFGSSAREALRMDPHQRLLMELFWEAMEDAGTPPPSLEGSRTAVMVGFSDPFQYGRIQAEQEGVRFAVDPYAAQGSSMSVVAGRLAYHFDLRGPTLALDTACSSSLVAVHQAGEALRRGECDLALAGAASLVIHPDMYVNGCSTSMFAPDGLCKTFDANADGYVLGEGGGVVVLERLSDALRTGHRIHAVIRGSAVNQDGRSNGLTAPNRAAQVDVIRRAQAAARVTPDEVVYVEAHGSGTKLGDAIELGALGDVFGARSPERPLHVGAVKSNIGHTQAAAGMAGLIKTTLVLKRGLVPPNVNIAQLSETALAAGDIRPATGTVPLPVGDGTQVVGVSSFGWSGTNAHVVLEAAPAADAEVKEETSGRDSARIQLLPVSAADEAALRQHLSRLADGLGESALADVAFTLQSGRAEHEYRRAVIATDGAQAAARLAEASGPPAVRRLKNTPRVAFLLPDAGEVSPALGVELYGSDPVFAEAVDACAALAAERFGTDLRPHFAGGAVADAGSRRLLAFVVEYALGRAMERRGVIPHLVLGTGIGALVADCLTGELSLEDALRGAITAADVDAGADGHAEAVADVNAEQDPTADAVSWNHQADRIAANAQVCIELGPGSEDADARVLISGSDGTQGPIVLNALPEADESESARLLTVFGRLWELGVALDWDAVRGDRAGRGQIVRLPAYPFQRQRFWPEPIAKSQQQGESRRRQEEQEHERENEQQRSGGSAEHVELLKRRWTESVAQSPSTLSGRFVLLADAGGIADALARQLRGEGVQVIVARSNEELADEELAGEELRDEDGTLTIVDLSAVEERDELPAVLGASRSLARWGSGGRQGVRVLLATRGGHEVLDGEPADPAQSAVAVLPVVAAQEYLSLDVRGVDLDPASAAAEAAEDLLNELRTPTGDALVAYRARTRYAPDYTPGYTSASA